MPRWIVEGADRETGEDRFERIEAATAQDAEQAGYRMGMIISKVRAEPAPTVRPKARHARRVVRLGAWSLVAVGVSTGLGFVVSTTVFGWITRGWTENQAKKVASLSRDWDLLVKGERIQFALFFGEVSIEAIADHPDGVFVQWRATMENWNSEPIRGTFRVSYFDKEGRLLGNSPPVEHVIRVGGNRIEGGHTLSHSNWERIAEYQLEVLR
jgi:hypothetical protein